MTLTKFFFTVCTLILTYALFLCQVVYAQSTESNVNTTSQTETTQKFCGPYSLLVICKMSGIKTDLKEISQLAGTTEKGTSLKGLVDAAYKLGLNAKGLRLTRQQLLTWKSPLIAHVRDNHFLVVEKVIDQHVRLIEQDREPYLMPIEEFFGIWRGYVLAISNPEQQTSDQPHFRPDQPDIHIDEPTYDWGVADQEERVTHVFTIKNLGTQMLTISQVWRACNCLSAELLSDKIQPGNQTQLKVEYQSTLLDWGPQMTAAHIYSNDPDESVLPVTIQGLVVSEVAVMPRVIELGHISGQEKIVKKLKILDWGLRKLKIKSTMSSSSKITTALITQESDREAVIQVVVLPGIPKGEVKEQVIIQTNHPQTPEVKVQIRGRVTGPIQVFPPQFFFGLIQRDQLSSQSVMLRTQSPIEFQITDVETKTKGMTAEITVRKKGYKYLVNLSWVADKDTPKTIKNVVRIHTNHPDQPVIEVPVYGIVQ